MGAQRQGLHTRWPNIREKELTGEEEGDFVDIYIEQGTPNDTFTHVELLHPRFN